MSKDYSHIKPGMYVSLEGIGVGSELELSIIDAFVKAGARKDEGRDDSFNYKMECRYHYFGWSFDYGTYFTKNEGYSGFSEQVSVDFTLNGPKTGFENAKHTEGMPVSNLSKGDKFKIKNNIPSIYRYKSGDWYTFHSYCNKDTGVVTQEDVDARHMLSECWVETEHIDFSSIVKTSSEAPTIALEEKVTEVLDKEENGLESNTGASVNISVLVSVQGNNYQLSRDQAYKLWEDLTEIFEEKIV